MKTLRLLAATLAVTVGLAASAGALTEVNSNITVDTNWDLAGSPYLVYEPLTIGTGATLTIGPGVEVAVLTAPISVAGTLLANGTPEMPITFRDMDGPWGGLRFINSTGNILNGVNITGVTASGSSPLNYGGGVYLESSTAEFHFATISGGTAYRGGGVYVNYNSDVIFTDSEISGNQSSDVGGGIAVFYGSSATLSRCLITNNSAGASGGGAIYAFGSNNNEDATVTLTNCTVANNTDFPASSSLFVASSAQLILRNSIVWGNTGGILNETGMPEKVAVSYSDVPADLWPGNGNISADPLFATDFSLLPGSPAINTGDPAVAYNDPDGTQNDMGAIYFPQQVEVQQFLQLPTATVPAGTSGEFAITGTVVGNETGTGVKITFTIDPSAVQSVTLVSTPFPNSDFNREDNTIHLSLASEANVTITEGVIATLSFAAPANAVRSATPLTWVTLIDDPQFGTSINEQPVAVLVPGTLSIPDNPPVWTPEPQNAGVLENGLLEFGIKAYDQDSDPITYSMSGLPEPGEQGPSLDPVSGAFSWTPSYDQAGVYTVTFTASTIAGQPTKPAWSGVGVSIQKTVTITVTNVDRAPYWVLEPYDQPVLETATLSFQVQAADYDLLEVPTYSSTTLPAGASFEGGQFNWTPSYEQSGAYPITFTATSGPEPPLTVSKQVTITVMNNNRNPVWVLTGSQAVDEKVELSFTVSATDEDAQTTLTYGALNLPDGATFGTGTQLFSWVPEYNQAGSYDVTFTVSDGEANVEMPVTITVNNVDQAPTWTNEPPSSPVIIAEGALLSFPVSANDPDVGEVAIVSASNLPPGAEFQGGLFSWTPGYTQASEVPYLVKFSATGAPVGTKPAGQVPVGTIEKSVEITVTNTDQAPYWTPAPPPVVSVNEMATVSFTITATDLDPEDVAGILYTATGIPTGASLNPATGAFSWVPTFAQAGQYEVTFTATSGPGSLTVTGQTIIEVNNVNRAPEWAQTAPQTVNENQTLSFTVLATDADGTVLSYAAYNVPSNGDFNPDTRLFSFNPNFYQAGEYTVTFQVSDGEAWVDMPVVITVNNVNQLPVWTPIADQSVPEGSNLAFAVSVSDPDETQLEVTAVTKPSSASFEGLWFDWTPGFNDAGPHEVTLRAWDGEAEVFETFTITVTNTNQPPVWSPILPQPATEGQLLTFPVSASDADGQTLTYSAPVLPDGATLVGATFSWTPTFLQSGIHTVTFNVSDGETTVPQDVYIDVANVSQPPVWGTMPTPDPVGAGLPVTFTVSATDPFEEGVYYGLAEESPGSIDPATGVFTWTPWYNVEGPITIWVTATNRDGTSYAEVTVNVFSRYGDATESGTIDAADAAAVLQYSVKLPVEINPILADVTGNEMVSAYDAALILHKLIINPAFRFPVQNYGQLVHKTGSGLPASLVWERANGGWALRATNTFGLMAGEFTLSLPGGAPVNVTGGDMVAFRQDGDNLFVSVIGSSFADGTLFFIQTTEGTQPGILNASLNEGAIPLVAAAPSAFTLEQNSPNPFNPSTTIRFALPEASQVNLVVYDVNGRAIRTLASGSYSAGMHSVVWDARDDGGREVATGTYIYRIVTDKGTFVKRMTLLK